MVQRKSTRVYLLLIAGLAVFLMSCGLINRAVEQAVSAVEDIAPLEELVEGLVEPPDEVPDVVQDDVPVVIDPPADIAEQPDLAFPVDIPLYPGADLFDITYIGDQPWVYRYLTSDSIDDVLAFYEAQFSYIYFTEATPCMVWHADEEHYEQFFTEYIGPGIHNFWVCRTDQAYLNMAAVIGEHYISAEVLESLPRNRTLIEIWVAH